MLLFEEILTTSNQKFGSVLYTLKPQQNYVTPQQSVIKYATILELEQ